MSPIVKDMPRFERLKPTHTQPGGFQVIDEEEDEDLLINDSFGTIDIADSTGTDEERETGDAKVGNLDTRED